jgi:hypothetical protein
MKLIKNVEIFATDRFHNGSSPPAFAAPVGLACEHDDRKSGFAQFAAHKFQLR